MCNIHIFLRYTDFREWCQACLHRLPKALYSPLAEWVKTGKEASVILRENSSSGKPVMAKRYGILTLKCNGCYFVDEKSGTLDAEIKWHPREVDEICLDCKGKKRRGPPLSQWSLAGNRHHLKSFLKTYLAKNYLWGDSSNARWSFRGMRWNIITKAFAKTETYVSSTQNNATL